LSGGALSPAPSVGCVANIGPREQRRRLIGGAIQLSVALLVLVVLLGTGQDRWWRLAVSPLFLAAASGFYQWRDKT
jgi:hypothetical protein